MRAETSHAPRATRAAAAGVAALAAVVTLGALALKGWCGSPADAADLYLRWCYSDIPPLFVAERLHEGAVPYLDHAVEYPVLTGAAMWLAGLFVTTPLSFLWATGVLLVVCAAGTGWLLAREVGWMRACAFAAAPTLLISGAVNWDLVAVVLATGGLIAHRRARDGWSGTLLGLGAAAKLYPAIFLLPVVLAAWRLRGRRAALTSAGTAVAAWTAVNLPVALAAPDSWLEFFRLSRQRPSDWDALTSVAAEVFGFAPPSATLNLLTGAGFVVLAVAVMAVAVRRDAPERWHLAALPLLAAFLLTSKVYSPQFSVWLLPLLALAFPGWRWWSVFAVADVAVTATRFPYLANFVGNGVPGAWEWEPFGIALVTRAAVLTAVAIVGWRWTARAAPGELDVGSPSQTYGTHLAARSG